MDSLFPVVSKDIAQELEGYAIDGFQLFPSIIVGDDGTWHEDFYFFNIYERLDCIDFEKSQIRNYKPDSPMHTVLRFKLDSDVLDSIEEESRLIINAEDVMSGALLVHERIVRHFNKFDIDAFLLYKLSDYEYGMEYR
ncbi:hypothetical protein L4C34_17345 [Vibrio profundum]|uniref:imm11 family protein n=1 Tax=Vibrio profundum TaxID=2910247 RepID=UPI003D0E8918